MNLYCYCYNNPVTYADSDGRFPFLTLTLISAALILGGVVLGGISASQNNRNVLKGMWEGAIVGFLLSASLWLIVGGFCVPNGIGSRLGLMMVTYGYSTLTDMISAGATQIRYSNSKNEPWASNLIRSLAANALKIYSLKALPKIAPVIPNYLWLIDEKYSFTIPGQGGLYYDYRTSGEAWKMFKQYLSGRPSLLSYGFAIASTFNSTYTLFNSIFGTPNYEKWKVF